MITDNFEQFAGNLISQVDIDLSNFELDHFGFQTSSATDYENLKKQSFEIGEMISENIVSGRRVAIFRFNKPFKYKNYFISGFELVEPKEGQVCKSELDHLEFVIPMSFDEFINFHQSIDWDLAAKDREEFPKINIKLQDGKSIKFHTQNIFLEIPD